MHLTQKLSLPQSFLAPQGTNKESVLMWTTWSSSHSLKGFVGFNCSPYRPFKLHFCAKVVTQVPCCGLGQNWSGQCLLSLACEIQEPACVPMPTFPSLQLMRESLILSWSPVVWPSCLGSTTIISLAQLAVQPNSLQTTGDENPSFTSLSFCQCKAEFLNDFKKKQQKTKHNKKNK